MPVKLTALVGFVAVAISLAGSLSAEMSATPATLAVDLDTTSMLVSGFADAPQPADLTAQMLTIAIALSDVESGLFEMDTTLRIKNLSMPVSEAVRRLALNGDRAAMTLLAAHLSQTPEIFTGRLNEMALRVGGRATHIEVTVGPDGAPTFSGTTTLRDTARAVAALLQTFGPETQAAFAGTSLIPGGILSTEASGVCVLTAKVVETNALVLSAGGSKDECLERATKTGSQLFKRILAERAYEDLTSDVEP